MTEFERGRGGKGRGRGNFQGRGNSGATSSFKSYPPQVSRLGQASQSQVQPIRNTELSREIIQSNRTRQGPSLETIQSSPSHEGPSLETIQSSDTPEVENGGTVFCSNKKRRRGLYKSKSLDMKTKCGIKITINIPDDIDRAVGDGARDIVNYCGLIMRSTISLKEGNWKAIVLKYGEVMWLKVKDKFEVQVGVREHVLQGFVISTIQRLYRSWKARLSRYYSCHKNDEDISSQPPQGVEPEDWKYLTEYFESQIFKRNSETGEKQTPDKVWEIQHTPKNDNGEIVWSDAQSQQVHEQLQELVTQQHSEGIENPMTRDEMLTSVLGERTGYVRGLGYGKKPPKKSRLHQVNIEASVSSAMDIARQEMQADMNQKLQDDREKMAEELQRKLEEERVHMKLEIQEQMAAFMTRMLQQGQSS